MPCISLAGCIKSRKQARTSGHSHAGANASFEVPDVALSVVPTLLLSIH